jgi:5-oxoprolinase (ATP-hydrolysing) subunit A
MGTSLDLNCDMGESFGVWRMGDDEAVLAHVTSANVACGFHAGDPGTMRHTVELAHARGVAIGAHPSLPDLQGFGRRELNVAAGDVYDMVLYQIGALAGICRSVGARLHHVKPHGALYNMAARDPRLAASIARAVRDFDPELVLYGLARSHSIEAARELGVPTANEVFADRTYQTDGGLTPRGRPDALIHDPAIAVAQVARMVQRGEVVATDGSVVAIEADTLCIHGDQPGAARFAREIRAALEGWGVAPFDPSRVFLQNHHARPDKVF